jgi:hypothetical protein
MTDAEWLSSTDLGLMRGQLRAVGIAMRPATRAIMGHRVRLRQSTTGRISCSARTTSSPL